MLAQREDGGILGNGPASRASGVSVNVVYHNLCAIAACRMRSGRLVLEYSTRRSGWWLPWDFAMRFSLRSLGMADILFRGLNDVR